MLRASSALGAALLAWLVPSEVRAEPFLADIEIEAGLGGGSQRLDPYVFDARRGGPPFHARGSELGYGGMPIVFLEWGPRFDFRWFRIGLTTGASFPAAKRDAAPRSAESGPVSIIGSGGVDLSLRLPLGRTTLYVGALAGPRFTFLPLRNVPETTCGASIPTSTKRERAVTIPYACPERANAALWYLQPRIAFEYQEERKHVGAAFGAFVGVDVVPVGAVAVVGGVTVAVRFSLFD